MDIISICGAICAGMLYTYSIILIYETIKTCIKLRTDERQNQNAHSGFEGFQQRTNNNVEEINNNETVTS